MNASRQRRRSNGVGEADTLYEEGAGGPKSYKLASAVYEMAFAKNVRSACSALGSLRRKMGVQRR